MGTFRFEAITFRLMNATTSFQRMMNEVLKRPAFARVFIDEVGTFSKTLDDHVIHIEEVVKRISNYYLKIKMGKCLIAQTPVKLLGHMVDREGIAIDPGKVSDIKLALRPASKAGLRSFLGNPFYYSSFINNFAR